MKYCIFSVDDSRERYKTALRKTLEWEEVEIDCVDGRIEDQLKEAQEEHPYEIKYHARLGHLGIWYSVLNALEQAPIVTFEDDALLTPLFHTQFSLRYRRLPEDVDFFSLFIPRDSDHMWNGEEVASGVTKTYQRYGGVSMYYTENGAKKIKALLERDGITQQYDETLYSYSKTGELNGYCSTPNRTDLVYITGEEDSIVQETEYAG